MISDSQLTQAIEFLAETDEPSAELKAQVARKEFLAKRIRAKMFLMNDEGSIESRKARAEISNEVLDAETELHDAIVEFEKVRAKRATQALIVEVWRTISANKRQGQI
jgi:hypothetical protein